MLKVNSFLLIFWLLAGWVRPQAQAAAVITAPLAGEALLGQVLITGTAAGAGFQRYEVAFAYQNSLADTWFLISQSDQAVTDGLLATWDTSTITDGKYRLRLAVFFEDGRSETVLLVNMRVRNYTAIETSTPRPPATAEPGAAGTTPTPSGDYVPGEATPTALPGNPAAVNTDRLVNGLMWGGLIALGLFIILGVYVGLRGLFHRG